MKQFKINLKNIKNNNFYSIIYNKEGNEVIQSLVIIAIIGGISITVVSAFIAQLNSSIGGKIKDTQWQTTANARMEEVKKEMSENQTISLSHF